MDPILYFRRMASPSDAPPDPKAMEATILEWDKYDPQTYKVEEDCWTKDQCLVYQGCIPGKDRDWMTATAKGPQGGFVSGKHYFEVHISCDNIRIGVATKDANTKAELGSDSNSWAVDLQTGDIFTKRSDRRDPEGVFGQLYKLLVPISGGRVGIYLDCDNGNLAIFFNGEYQGMACGKGELKGKGPLYPSVGIGGLEGKKVALPRFATYLPKIFNYKRNKI
eukprot:NODE_4559_length_788_cov_55.621110_g3789_i0.p2 GENE.NODE_4559_length_788_cov_55.621110_g3789_i0~~NODE_4559_length_788_cov_55.621110_g3789_i0.p2  ORF type:complete len:229 (-),score=66.01 NODE_4559_length_788_cov_55.621110_g3789_i0:100-765(-)